MSRYGIAEGWPIPAKVPWETTPWRPSPRVTAQRQRRAEESGVSFDPDPFFDDWLGHCWRCSHRTHNADRTCDFCLAEITADG